MEISILGFNAVRYIKITCADTPVVRSAGLEKIMPLANTIASNVVISIGSIYKLIRLIDY